DELTVGFDLMSLHEDPNALPLPPQRREYLAELQSIASHRPRYRMPVTLAPQLAETRFSTLPPAKAELRRRITVFVPKNAGKEDEILLHCLETGETFESRVMDAHPVIAGALQLRLGVFVNALLGRAIDDLTKAMAAVWQRDQ
ncbi:MAG TPA: hypothetical protein VMU84_05545, partial [Thermoanaerobaculia bacterium]|nr:hypothetical protein [Thermoanaerobaculia bacterium]